MSTFKAQTLAQSATEEQLGEESPQSNLYPAPLLIRKVSQGVESIQLAMPIRTNVPDCSLDMLLDGVRGYQAKAKQERDTERQVEVAMKTENDGEVKLERPVKKAMKIEHDGEASPERQVDVAMKTENDVEPENVEDENGNGNVKDRDGDETESDNQSSSSSSSDMDTQAGSIVDEDEYVDVEMEDIDDLSDLLGSSEDDDHHIIASRSMNGNGLGISLLTTAMDSDSGSGSTTNNATASTTPTRQPLLPKVNRKPLPSSTKLPESDDDETEDENEDEGASVGEAGSPEKIHITTANMTWGESMLYREPGLAQFRVARPSRLRVCWTWVEVDQGGGGSDLAENGSEEGEIMEGM